MKAGICSGNYTVISLVNDVLIHKRNMVFTVLILRGRRLDSAKGLARHTLVYAALGYLSMGASFCCPH
jgi:hypothetical protein